MYKKLLEMQKELLEEIPEESEDDSEIEMNEDEIKDNLPSYSSEKLSDFVISHRYLGLYEKLSVLAMEELSRRRIAGDNFKYEDYIEKNLKELPVLNFEMKNINNIIASFKGLKNGK